MLGGILLLGVGNLKSDFDHSNLFQSCKQLSVNTEHQINIKINKNLVGRSLLPVGKYWSPGRPLKILYDCPGTSWSDVPGTSQSDVLKWRPGDVLIWCSRGRLWDVDSRCLQDVLRTSPRGPLEYSNLDVPAFF